MDPKRTFKEKFENWWWYHKIHCFIAAACLFVIVYVTWSAASVVKPDYEVALISTQLYSEEKQAQITDALEQFGEDCNGDGRVSVYLNVYNVDLVDTTGQSGTYDYMDITRMDADLVANISGMYLVESPEAFQYQTQALTYRDGTIPPEDAEDVENMVIDWKNVTGLKQVDAGEVYLGLRPNSEEFENYFAMWNRILEAEQ